MINPTKKDKELSDAGRAILSLFNPRRSTVPQTATELLFGVAQLPPPPPVPRRLTLDTTWALHANSEDKENTGRPSFNKI